MALHVPAGHRDSTETDKDRKGTQTERKLAINSVGRMLDWLNLRAHVSVLTSLQTRFQPPLLVPDSSQRLMQCGGGLI